MHFCQCGRKEHSTTVPSRPPPPLHAPFSLSLSLSLPPSKIHMNHLSTVTIRNQTAPSTDLGILVVVSVPSGLQGSLVVALDLAGLGVDDNTPGGHGDLHAPLATAGLGQFVSAAHSVLRLPYRWKIQLLVVGCLTSQQHASASQGRICSDNSTCCHTEIEAADQTFHLTQSQYSDTGLTSPSTDPLTPGAWQGSHWSVNF